MNIGNKRKDVRGDNSTPKRVKKVCDYGEKCYRRNPAHFREFSHKHLESILDQYSGTGDYPIPEKYVMERLTIMEQLDVIVEKELHIPWKNNSVVLQATTSTSNTPNVNVERFRSINKGTGNNAEGSGRNVGSSNQNAESSNRNVGSSNRSSGLSSDVEMSSINAEGSSRNVGSRNRTAESSNRSVGSSNNSSGLSSNVEKISINAEVSSKNSSQGSNNNNMSSGLNLDYKKAADYRPIVPPTRRVEDFLSVVRPKGKMATKHTTAAPYYIFYTTITAARETHAQPNSITFQEILDSSLGELNCSLQINFMVELGWLLAQYYFAGYSNKKLTILYGEDMPELRTISEKKPHINAYRIAMPTPFGTHHTKMMLLCYEDGSLRVVISTANLYLDDWENRTQGLWFSPACPLLPADSMPHDGESPTLFKRCLLRYLQHYHLPSLASYVERVKRCDFSHINVFLVASVPGSHSDSDWGMLRVSSLLRQHCTIPDSARWPLLAQASSLGSYGTQPKLWLTGDFLHNFTKTTNPPKVLTAPPEFKLIYPSLENVRQSHDGLLGGGCLPYGAAVQAKQPWLNNFLYQWRAISTARDRAMPHIKSYTRVSPDSKMAAYYLLTSANASKAAWGSVNKGNGNLRLMSYEAGVLFLPQFVINQDVFPLVGNSKLCLPYDLPPTKYTADMSPWVMDYLHT